MIRKPPRRVLAATVALALTLGCASAANADTYTVQSNHDGGGSCPGASCTLRDALDAANNNAGPDTIKLASDHYVIGSLLLVSDDTTIVGAGKGATFIDANGSDRVIDDHGNVLNLSDLTVEGGSVGPCAECSFDGGAIYGEFGSELNLTDVRVTHNRTPFANGGGISAYVSNVTLTRVEVDHNYAAGSDEGGLFTNGGGGGGIAVFGSTLTITDSWIHDNTTSEGDGGGIVTSWNPLAGTAFANAADNSDNGVAGDLTITGSTISDNNAARSGGGIANYAQQQDDFAPLTLAASAAPDNGIPSQSIVNSTISGNLANVEGTNDDRKELLESDGGGIWNSSNADLELINDSIVDNQLSARNDGSKGQTSDDSDGGGIQTDSSINLTNTLLAGNRADGVVENCAGEGYNSQGHNLDSGNTCQLDKNKGDLISTDPKVAPLRDNGGLSPTHALADDSPAIDAADNTKGPGLDERGGKRPPETGSAGATRDIGAYEAYSLGDLSLEAKAANASITAGEQLTYTVVARNDGNDKINGVKVSDTLPGDATFVSATTDKTGATCDSTVTCNLGTLGVNEVVRITIVVNTTKAGTLTNTAAISAAGITDPVSGNENASATTTVNAAPAPNTVVIPPQQTPSNTTPADKSIELNIEVPKQVDLDTFFNGILVEADCGDEPCLRKFREHAAVNTGATHIAGFNLTIERTSLGFSTKKKTVKLKPCVSGSKNGRAHKRCVRNLRKATEKAVPFRVKVVVSAVDRAGNHLAKKAYIKVVK